MKKMDVNYLDEKVKRIILMTFDEIFKESIVL